MGVLWREWKVQRSMVKVIHADGFYSPENVQGIRNASFNLPFAFKEYGEEVENFNMIPPGLEPIFSRVLGEEVSIDNKRSGVLRKPMRIIHFEDFESLDEWCFVMALERTTFNLYHHVSGAKSALEGHQFNYRNFLEWDYDTNILLEPNQGVFFRPWMFHSLENGLVQYYRLVSDKAFSETKTILIMGLPSSGKSFLAAELAIVLGATRINADEVRAKYNDWDFSQRGRHRQAHRMRKLAGLAQTPYTVVDFICPTQRTRDYFGADYTIWMDTVKACRYEDTTQLFEPPVKYDLRIDSFNYKIEDVIGRLGLNV